MPSELVGGMTTGQRRRNLLSYSGPVLITVTLSVWFLLLVLGWAMIYQPALGTAIRASSGPTDTGWATAVYYSGFNLTTLGVGDVAANTGAYRLLTVAEAAVGFAFFSMVITYFLSVYSSLTSRNAFAQGLHHLTGKTAMRPSSSPGSPTAPTCPRRESTCRPRPSSCARPTRRTASTRRSAISTIESRTTPCPASCSSPWTPPRWSGVPWTGSATLA